MSQEDTVFTIHRDSRTCSASSRAGTSAYIISYDLAVAVSIYRQLYRYELIRVHLGADTS